MFAKGAEEITMSQSAMQQALDALQDLYAEQNDAPLETRRSQWETAMNQALAAVSVLEKELALHTAGGAGPASEPLAWLYEDTLPDSYPYDEMFPHSEVRSGVRMFPVFGPPAIEANDAKDAAWQMKAAVWLRAKASEQEATNARYPRHAEAYPSWGERAKWWRSAADELAAMSPHQPKESGNG